VCEREPERERAVGVIKLKGDQVGSNLFNDKRLVAMLLMEVSKLFYFAFWDIYFINNT